MSRDCIFKPNLSNNLNDVKSNLMGSISKILKPRDGNVERDSCRGIRIVENEVMLCGNETSNNPFCAIHADIQWRTNALYHSIDRNFDVLLEDFVMRVEGNRRWADSLRQYIGLIMQDQYHKVPKGDIDNVWRDWLTVFSVLDDFSVFDYMASLDDSVYTFLVADIIYSLRLLSNLLLFDDIGIDVNHLRFMILTLRFRNKLASIINAPIVDIDFTVTADRVRNLLNHIDVSFEALLYVYQTLDFFSTFSKVQLPRRYDVFMNVDREKLNRRDRLLLDILLAMKDTNEELAIFNTQEPRDGCNNIATIKEVIRRMNSVPKEHMIREEEGLKKECNMTNSYADLYELLNCLVARVNRKFIIHLAKVERVTVIPRPLTAPSPLERDVVILPRSHLARIIPARTTCRVENLINQSEGQRRIPNQQRYGREPRFDEVEGDAFVSRAQRNAMSKSRGSRD